MIDRGIPNIPISPSMSQPLGQPIHAGNSMLVLISPRQYGDHWHRPMVYNFKNSVVNAIAENIVGKPTSVNSVRDIMDRCPEINEAIIPSANGGFGMQTSQYSDSWQFFLVIDGATNSLIQSNRLSTRTVMVGICSQEPISQMGKASATPEQFINPECQLIVTRRIGFNQLESLGMNGMQRRVENRSDIEIANYDNRVFADPMSTGDNYFAMTPSLLSNSTVLSDTGDMTSHLDSGESLNVKGSAKIAALMESPRRHMKEILTGFETGATQSMFENEIAGYGDAGNRLAEPHHELMTNVNKAWEKSYYQNTHIDPSDSLVDTEFMTLGMVMSKYHPRVVPVEIPRTLNAELLPQNVTSVNNIFASLVCSVIPSYMNSVGLSAVSFMHNSYARATQVMHIESTIATMETELKMKWKSFNYLLEKELYPILAQNGDFDLQIMSNLNGSTDCILNFMDFSPIPVGAIYREESILGGMLSPMIGTGQDLLQNSIQLNSLNRSVSAAASWNNNHF